MKNNKRKPLVLVGALALALITALAATFAWFSASDAVTNKLATKDGLANVNLQETFVPPDDWKPGQTVTKQVGVVNTGSAPALVRVSFNELLGVNTLISPAPTSAWNPTSTTTAPLLFDTTPFTSAPWVAYTPGNAAIGNVVVNNIPAGVTVYVNYAPAGTNGSSIDSWSFAAWAPITSGNLAGSAQTVTYTESWNQATKTMTMSNVTFGAYQLTSSNAIDWTAVTPASDAIGYSQAEAALNGAGAPTGGNYDQNIILNYNDAALDSTTPTTDKWYYNAADGYFYYIGLVQPGTSTASLLNSLTLSENADSAYYSNLNFDLTVNMEALQNTKDAIDTVWTTVTDDAALETALYKLCES
ncbi:MAG: BsaA family SipW-dependent biofilm matrix protein [Actinomycetia bacterium]|nr:BsaA family SipW-dependent biofilm matrix protein [Actinomycetes bacterium]